MEYERRHTVNQRRVIYLAVSGKLFSMFQVAYQSDPDTAAVLDFPAPRRHFAHCGLR